MIKTEVIIAVKGGVASLVSKSKNMIVKVRDYDVEGGDCENLQEDDNGNMYVEFEL